MHYNVDDKSVRAVKPHRKSIGESNDILYNVIRNLAEHKDQVCVHPELDPYHSSVIGFFHDVAPLECKEENDWIVVENGTFFISQEARAKHGPIKCQYVPICRGGDDYKIKNGKKETFQDGVVLAQSDFFKISCKAQDGERYFNVHATVSAADNSSLHFDTKSKVNTSSATIPLNVFMFGYDSVSRNTWKRKLPNSHEYFTNVLGGVVLEGYNIVGDGTPQALLPILTGKTEAELPESRRGKPDARPVDQYPWIWKNFQEAGYITQWAEDMAHIGTFNFRMLGFQEQPVHHYMRPFYLASEKIYSFNKPYCLGSLNRHKTMINWFRDCFTMYYDRPKFMFGFHSEFSHRDSNTLQWADDDLLHFLTFLYENKYLQNTLLILMSDHGARFHDIRKTLQGKYEERMPYFAFRFPDWFVTKYPRTYAKFVKNSKRLTTPFDIHETFLDLLYFNSTMKTKGNTRGISLLRRIPKDRKCEDAGISSHWCACLNWDPVSKMDGAVQRSAKSVLKFINTLTKKYRQKCHHLILQNITNAQFISANPNIVRFRGSSDLDGRHANFSNSEMPQHVLYQITLMTSPGNAVFEATVRYDRKSDDYRVNGHEISRINAYGNSADCIIHVAPQLRQYCYCTG
ncbi:hypothetical protein FSP39_020161 [Pinctada imbricata]|uniref:DUF229 domain containing protein n=1 Tax=Pinctada imbricata TaxID=66713 RepID=A0AA88YFS6_PINIB|nr:hypothetical protein FSP39_020161 [Pinctada imbricata]